MLKLCLEEGLHIHGGRQESIPELWWMALRVDWLCVFCPSVFILMAVIKNEKSLDYFYEVYLCITNVENYCILLRSKLFNEDIKLPFHL